MTITDRNVGYDGPKLGGTKFVSWNQFGQELAYFSGSAKFLPNWSASIAV